MRRNDPYKPNRPHPVRAKNPMAGRPAPANPAPKNAVPKPEKPKAEAGPRPLSAQQRAYQNLIHGRAERTELPTALPAATLPGSEPATRRITAFRDATVSRKRVVLNRRRTNYPRLWLGIMSVGFVVETIAALLFSPRLAVQKITVAGNQTIPESQILAPAKALKGQNLIRFPVGALQKAVLREPTFESVTVHRVWPDTVRIVVRERQPWASVTAPDGASYTIDSKWVPFRKTAAPEANLPHLTLALLPHESKPIPIILGTKMVLPGLSEVDTCLEWAKGRPDFPLESVSIDPMGKLCFNRVGGTQVQLGSATDLPRKLNALTLLMRRYDIADAAYVNLFAYDAPAVMPKNAVTTASARTHSSNSSSSLRRLNQEATDSTSEQP